MSEFFQDGPTLKNQYEDDAVLKSYLAWKLDEKTLASIQPGLKKLGERVVTDIFELAQKAEVQKPVHVPYDAWGKRIDKIEVSDAWIQLDRIAAEEKMVATAYERKEGAWSRVHQAVRLYLYTPSSAVYSCPLAMTDGAARAIELYGDEALKTRAFKHLTSSDPAKFWTSGQWMTERTGGSDVSGTSTVAKKEGDHYRLYGTKWFTSATTSQMAMTLARIEGAPEGSRGLSLFYLELRNPQGELNQIQVHRLKDKLGTWALPTAELTLNGTPAVLVGSSGDGVKKISSLFNITRIYNSISAISFMRRGIALAKNYATQRKAFGKLLQDHPLHVETLAEIEIEFEACFHLVFHAAELLGKEELGVATPEESATLRLLTPLAKLYTAKKSIQISSEVLECFGGAGYVEDTGLPKLLRDSQVLAIWEGTTNVLSLDMLRAIEKENGLQAASSALQKRLASIQNLALKASVANVAKSAEKIGTFFQTVTDAETVRTSARELAMELSKIFAASLMLEQAEWSLKTGIRPQSVYAAIRFSANLHTQIRDRGVDDRKTARTFVFE